MTWSDEAMERAAEGLDGNPEALTENDRYRDETDRDAIVIEASLGQISKEMEQGL
jgi:hypothetical protein